MWSFLIELETFWLVLSEYKRELPIYFLYAIFYIPQCLLIQYKWLHTTKICKEFPSVAIFYI